MRHKPPYLATKLNGLLRSNQLNTTTMFSSTPTPPRLHDNRTDDIISNGKGPDHDLLPVLVPGQWSYAECVSPDASAVSKQSKSDVVSVGEVVPQAPANPLFLGINHKPQNHR